MPRRPRSIAGLLLVLATGLVSTPAHAGTTPTPPPSATPAAVVDASLVPVEARPAADLIDSVGVGVHLGFLNTPYRDADRVLRALQDLGVRHVRDEFRPDQPRQWDSLRTLGAAGIRSDLIVGPRPDQTDRASIPAPAEQVATISRELAGSVESVEGTNEWDLWGGPTWADDVRAWQRGLYDAVKADAALADVPVLSPSIAMPWNWAAAGSFAGMADAVNAHLYPGGQQPAGVVEARRGELDQQVPGRPLVVTEAGYHNAVRSPDTPATGHPGVPESVSGSYLTRLVAGNLAAGAERTYLYELIDQFADPLDVHSESHFGLLRNDLSPKPAYLALRDLLALAGGGAATGPEASGHDTLRMAVDDAPDDLRRLVLQRPDGSFVVLLWRDVSTWDVQRRTAVAVQPSDVTLRLDHAGPIQVQRPGAGPGPVAAGTADRVDLRLGADLMAVVVDGQGTAPVVPGPTAAATTTSGGTATVTWDRPVTQVGGTSAYDVTLTPGGTTRVPSTTRRFTTGALQPGVPYRLSVSAVSPVGQSAAVSGAPVLLVAAPRSPVGVVVTPVRRGIAARWSPATAQGAPVTGYEVRVGKRVVTVPATRHHVRLTGITRRAAKKSQVQVRALSGAGASLPASGRVTRR